MSIVEFTLKNEYIALYQLLKLTGLCSSGGSAKSIIAAGEVRVDGEMETRKACKIRAGQEIQLDDTLVHVRQGPAVQEGRKA